MTGAEVRAEYRIQLLRDAIERMRADLITFGTHQKPCERATFWPRAAPVPDEWRDTGPPCTCGFSLAVGINPAHGPRERPRATRGKALAPYR